MASKRNKKLADITVPTSKKGNYLTERNTATQGQKLTHIKESKFRMSLSLSLNHNYSFKYLKRDGLMKLDNFISETVNKNLTITEVDNLFLRKVGPIKAIEKIKGVEREIVHYGKDHDPFRLHGFYDDNGYFVIYKIDPNHKVHKGK